MLLLCVLFTHVDPAHIGGRHAQLGSHQCSAISGDRLTCAWLGSAASRHGRTVIKYITRTEQPADSLGNERTKMTVSELSTLR